MATNQFYKFVYISTLRNKIKEVIGDKLELFLNTNFKIDSYTNHCLHVHFQFYILPKHVIPHSTWYSHYDEKKRIICFTVFAFSEDYEAINDIQFYTNFYSLFKNLLIRFDDNIIFNTLKFSNDISLYKFLHKKKSETTK